MKRKNNTIVINKFLIIGVVFCFALIIGKLCYVNLATIVEGTNIVEFANNRNTAEDTLYATRGNIVDVSGNILAQDVNSYTVVAFLSSKRTTDSAKPQHVLDKEKTAKELAPLINMTEEQILNLLNRDAYQVELGPGGRGITELTKTKIEALELPGIAFVSSTKRYYKMADFASYIVGYAKKDDTGEINGEMGIEKYFNDILKGSNGFKQYQKDAYGYQIPNTPELVDNPESGKDIYLTIDNNVQILVQNTIESIVNQYKLNWLTLTVADAKTGAIVASGSSPSFNPNTLEIESYVNPLVAYQYEPGSTMKIFSFMAAMENGVYNGSDTYKSGTITVADKVIKDHNNGVGWGTITYDFGFANSSNVAATMLAQKIGKKELSKYYNKLGFGKKTGIDLPNELSGDIGFNYDVEVATASFGQGITTTPVQNIQALTALANNGVMLKPYIISKIVDTDTGKTTFEAQTQELDTVASTETITKIKQLMKDVIDFGTGKSYKSSNVSLFGKTGTAQIAASGGGYQTGKYDNILSFAGLFPYEEPRYIIYLSAKQFIGATSQMGKEISTLIEEIAKYKNITESESALDESKIINLKSYISTDTETTVNKLNDLGLKPIVIGDGTKAINQFPLKNTTVVAGTKVFLLTNSNNITMLDIKNWSSNEVATYCKLTNIKCNYNGYGYVDTYSIPKGTKLDENSQLDVTLKVTS